MWRNEMKAEIAENNMICSFGENNRRLAAVTSDHKK